MEWLQYNVYKSQQKTYEHFFFWDFLYINGIYIMHRVQNEKATEQFKMFLRQCVSHKGEVLIWNPQHLNTSSASLMEI